MIVCYNCFFDLETKLDKCPVCGDKDLQEIPMNEFYDFLLDVSKFDVLKVAGYLTKYKNCSMEEVVVILKRLLPHITEEPLLVQYTSFMRNNIEVLSKQGSNLHLATLFFSYNRYQFGWSIKMAQEFVDLLFIKCD